MDKGLLLLCVWLLLSGCSKPNTNDRDVSDPKTVEKAESNDSPDRAEETYELNGWYKMQVEFYDIYDNPPGAVAPMQIYKYVYKDEAVCLVYYYVDIFEELWNIKVEPYYCFKVSCADIWYINIEDGSLETNVWEEKGVYKIISSSKDSLCFELDEKRMGKFTKSHDVELHSLFDNAIPMDIDKVYSFLDELYSNSLL